MSFPVDQGKKGAGHRKRLRQRFLDSGLDGFHDYEVIELLLTLVTPRKDCKDAAKEALKRFGSFQAVLDAGAQELQEINGIGPQNQIGIRLIRNVADRYLERRIIHKDAVLHSKALFEFLRMRLSGKKREHFMAFFLDAKNRILTSRTLFSGSLTSSSVYPREVVKAALAENAAALIFVHNHPSGDPQPSRDDIEVTRQLIQAAQVMSITVHDHIIIGADGYFSMADQGIINSIKTETESNQ